VPGAAAALGEVEQQAGLAGLARRGLISLVGSGVSAVAGVLVVLAVTRTLPADTAGTFFALTSVFLIAEMVARLGTGTGLVWAISRARAVGLRHSLGDLLRVALVPVFALSLALGAALFVAADEVARLLGDGDPGTALAVRILAVLLPLTTASDSLVAATRGSGAILPTVLIDRIGRPLVQLAAVVLAALGGSLAVLCAAWALPWVLSALLAAWWLARVQHRSAARATAAEPAAAEAAAPEESHRPWREFWTFTGPRAVTTIVQLALQRMDIVLLTLLAGPAPAAIYTAATRFLVVGQVINQGISTVTEPRISRLLAREDRAAAAAVYQTTTAWLVLLCWPMYLLVAAFAGPITSLFGPGYDAGAPVVVILACTMLVASGVGTVDVLLIMGGRTRWNLGNSLAALAVNIGLDVLLIPDLGIIGAAVGWSAAILVNNLVPLAQVWRFLGLHPFGRAGALAMTLALVCFGALPLAARAAFDSHVAVAGAAVVGLVLYLAGAWRGRRTLALDGLRPARRAEVRAARGQPAAVPPG
jgi:O-antigen/teichoic acid export membrane protein